MNCRQTRDFISAYLDQELTGQQMLEIHAHLGVCDDCARECRETREVRRVLRSLVPYCPSPAAAQRLAARLDQEARPGLAPLTAGLLNWLPALRWDWADSRPRGRRLASALALSSVAVLAVAAPLVAPPASEATGRGAVPTVQAGLGGIPWVTLPVGWSGALFPALRLPEAPALAQPYAQTAAQNMEVEPLRDEAVSEYAQGDLTLTGFQSPAAGRR